jgi:hypothetical protein
METQYSTMEAIINAHHHDDEIDTKAVADATFFSTSLMGHGSGFDADKVDGLHVADILAEVLPVGSIIWFKGTDAEIPTGWKICTGQAGTSDFRDRFVIGAGGSYAVGSTGGPATWNGTITPTGSATVGDHQLTISELPGHTHTYSEYYFYGGNRWAGSPPPVQTQYVLGAPTNRNITTDAMTTGDGSHGHAGSSISFSGVDPRPPYYSLYLIKKVI